MSAANSFDTEILYVKYYALLLINKVTALYSSMLGIEFLHISIDLLNKYVGKQFKNMYTMERKYVANVSK